MLKKQKCKKGLFKWQKWRYNAVDKKITKLDSVRSDSPQRLLLPVWEVWKAERKKIKNKNTFDFLKEESVMAKTKIAVLWGLLIAMMVACAGIFATLKAREMNPYIGSTGTYVETVQPNGEASAVVADNVVTVND